MDKGDSEPKGPPIPDRDRDLAPRGEGRCGPQLGGERQTRLDHPQRYPTRTGVNQRPQRIFGGPKGLEPVYTYRTATGVALDDIFLTSHTLDTGSGDSKSSSDESRVGTRDVGKSV